MTETVAFMVMPFQKKPTGKSGDHVPESVDFDQLWRRVHKPVLEALGYRAVRADADIGAFVVKEMIQRLAAADLVVADISLANANVYYEVGVRHAAQERGCVLVAADWADPVFDLRQMRRLQYPLADGSIGAAAATQARRRLREGLSQLAGGRSPVFEAVPGYPDDAELSKLTAFEDLVDTLSSFDAEVEAIRATADDEARRQRMLRLLSAYGDEPVVRQSAVLELLRLVRDNLGWAEVVAYSERLPARLQRHPLVIEQRLLAQAKQGDPAGAIGALKQLIRQLGPTSERQGLLGGRYKQLLRNSRDPAARRRYLDLAIQAYEQGMQLDLNDYYPASNLPRLYRQRGGDGDEQRAVAAATVTLAACTRSIALDADNEWTRSTLLGAAFDAGDVDRGRRLLSEIRRQGPAPWQLESTLEDLVESLELQQDPEVRRGLGAVLDALRELARGGIG